MNKNKAQSPESTQVVSTQEEPVRRIKVRELGARLVKLDGGRELTLVARLVKDIWNDRRKHTPPTYHIFIGHAIKNAADERNLELGALIASNRAMDLPYFSVQLRGNEVPPAFASGLLDLIEQEFKANLENYVPFGSKRKYLQSGGSETNHLTSTPANTERLEQSLSEADGQPGEIPVVTTQLKKRPYVKRSKHWAERKGTKVQRRKKKVGSR